MDNITKIQIAISLFSGGVLAISVFIGTLAGDFLLSGIKTFQKNRTLFIFGLIFSIVFIGSMWMLIRFSLQVLFNPASTDFSFFGNVVKKIFMIK